MAERFRPELALLDIGLPAMDGYELAKRMKARAVSSLRLVALTGYGQPGDRMQSEEAGFDAHLVKPAGLDEIEQVVARLLAT